MSQPRTQSGLLRAFVLFGRAITVRCPVCGSGGLFHSWFKIKESCPGCSFLIGRGESGYQLGSMALDLIIPLLLWIATLVTLLITTWPTPPWALIQWGSIVFIIGMPLLLYPMSHTLAIALDVLVRPPDSVPRHPRPEKN
ncbi:MAG: DUF983 domain-containing protein [Chloroflexota bacterium]